MDVRAGEMVTDSLRLVRELGRGGMGSVWVADHLTLETEVAIKFVLTALGDREAALARFRREATAAAQIKSPHVVQIFDHGVTDDDTPYIVMELLEGESLAEHLDRRGRLEPEEVAIMLEQLAKALAAAHHGGIVHRDIKPENIFRVAQPGAPADEIFVKLLDFGIARPVAGDPSSQVTETGALIGTPAYMSPEQLADTARIGPATDLWALGVVAYRALLGKLPFEGDTPVSYWRAMSSTRFAAPSSLVRELSVRMDEFFARAFRVEPDDRFESARAMAIAFREHVGGTGALISSSAHGRPADTLKDGDRQSDPSAHAATELASMGTADFVDREQLGVDLEARAGQAGDEAAGSDGEPTVAGEVASDGIEPDGETSAAPPAAATAVPAGQQSTSFGAALGTAASQSWRGGRSRTIVYVGAVGLVAGALWLNEQRGKSTAPHGATSALGSTGPAASPSNEVPKAPALRQPKLGLKTLREFHDPTGASLANLKSASLWAAVARDFADANERGRAPKRWVAAEHFAHCQKALVHNELDEALAACRKAAELDPKWADPHAGQSAAQSRKGDLDAALEAAEKAQRLEPSWWRAVAIAAAAYSKAGKFPEGIQEFRRALELAPDNAVLLGELSLMYHAARMDSEAERYADQALEADPDLVAVRVMRAERALLRADGKSALAEATRAVAVAPKDVPSRLAYADAHALLGHRDQALAEYRRTLELRADGGIGGAPADRIAAVEKAVAKAELPPPRHASDGRSMPAAKQRSRPTSKQRSRPSEDFDALY